MNIPYETLVLIAASGGAIIIFGIAVAILCICRHVRRSRKAVIHILTTAPHGVEDADAATDDPFWEGNQLIPTAHILHSFNPRAKIHAICPSSTPTQNPNTSPSELLSSEKDVEKIPCLASNLKQEQSETRKHEPNAEQTKYSPQAQSIPNEPLQPKINVSNLSCEPSVPNSEENGNVLNQIPSETSVPSSEETGNDLSQIPTPPPRTVSSRQIPQQSTNTDENYHLPTCSNELSPSDHDSLQSQSSKRETLIHLHLKPYTPLKQCSLSNDPTQAPQSSSFSTRSNFDEVMEQYFLQQAQSVRPIVHPSSLPGSSTNTPRLCNERFFRGNLRPANAPDRTNSESRLQPESSHRRCSKNLTTVRRSLSKPSTSGTQNSHLHRTQSFQERTSVHSHSEPSEGSRAVQQFRRPGINESRPEGRQNMRNVNRNRRSVVRSRSMLTSRQLERAQMLQQTNSSVNRRIMRSSAEDVYVLDGSEPPPPYHS